MDHMQGLILQTGNHIRYGLIHLFTQGFARHERGQEGASVFSRGFSFRAVGIEVGRFLEHRQDRGEDMGGGVLGVTNEGLLSRGAL